MEPLTYKIYRKIFLLTKKVKWDNVIEKINLEFQNQTYKNITSENACPTFVLHTDFYPESLGKAYREVQSKFPVVDMHTYISFSKNSSTFGRHADDMDVLIAPAIGQIEYVMDPEIRVTLKPGDALYIPKGMYHAPVVIEPRVTLSLGLPG